METENKDAMTLSDSTIHPPRTVEDSNIVTIVCAASGTLIIFLLQVIVVVVLIWRFISKRKTDNISTHHHPTKYKGHDILKHTDHEPVDNSHLNFENDDGIIVPADQNKHQNLTTDSHIPSGNRREYTETPHPIVCEDYTLPVATQLQVPLSNRIEMCIIVPSQEQRKVLSTTEASFNPLNFEGVHKAIEMSQDSNECQALSFFEESEIYWEPSSNTTELYQQLFTKKYREIPRAQLQVISELGGGQFGTVHKGIWQSPMGAMDVAVKTLRSGAKEEEKVKFLQEAAINGQFRHPNVVQLMGVVTVEEPVMIVLELIKNGDLRKYLIKQRPLPGEILPTNTPQVLLNFCKQIASGMEYLSRKRFVHRDLAARNVLLTDNKTCKISDFGMSRDLLDDNYYISHGGMVPVKWTAPEALNYKKYSTASDVWSFGCVMYEIWSLGHKPFEAHTNRETVKIVDNGYRLSPPPGCPKEIYRTMIQCWHPERSQRPSFPNLVKVLSRPDFDLLEWNIEDFQSNPLVCVLGGSLDITQDLYPELQRAYYVNN